MAGSAIRRSLYLELSERAAAASTEDVPLETPLDYVCWWIESGRTLASLAFELSTKERQVQPATLRKTLENRHPGGKDEVARRLKEARREAAPALAEQTIDREIADKDDAAVARVEASRLQWLAEKWDPASYGDQKPTAPQVQINFGSLLLQAHREIAAHELTALPAEIVQDEQDRTDDHQDQAQPQGAASQAPGAQAGNEDPDRAPARGDAQP